MAFKQDPLLPFRQRPLLKLGDDLAGLMEEVALSDERQSAPRQRSPSVSIMTYNMLAQSLARSSQFPSSKSALRWKTRSPALVAELKYYNPDIVCVQELDECHWRPFWVPRLQALGYRGIFHAHESKSHGVAIFYKHSKFVPQAQKTVDYDADSTLPKTKDTGNVALLVHLAFQPSFAQHLSRDGILVGTTHAFWNPYGAYERCRQAQVLTREFQHFRQTILAPLYNFVAGDFNTSPEFPPYRLLTNRGFCADAQVERTLARSRDHDYSTLPFGGNPAPEHYVGSAAAADAYARLCQWRRETATRAVSLYGVAYLQVHPQNCRPGGEPQFSNYCEHFISLLDYIFVMSEQAVDTVDELELECHVRLVEVLRMPALSEMGPGLPQREYPSDHLCMMARVELR